jgi:hypothetical protein
MMAKKSLPHQLFVHWEEYSDHEVGLVANETAGDGAEVGVVRVEGRYVLQEVTKVTAEVKIDRRRTR